MLTRRTLVPALAAIAAAWSMPVNAAQEKDTLPKPPDKLVLGEDDVRRLLLLMDANKDGKISKQEWMDFMSAEFDRLDKDKNGSLDIREISHSRVRATHFADMGK
jgi:hypothetical protein